MMTSAANTQSHEWIGRFCVQLIRARPGTTLPSAVHRAVAAYPYTRDLEPEDAAAMALGARSNASRWTPSRGRFEPAAHQRRV